MLLLIMMYIVNKTLIYMAYITAFQCYPNVACLHKFPLCFLMITGKQLKELDGMSLKDKNISL